MWVTCLVTTLPTCGNLTSVSYFVITCDFLIAVLCLGGLYKLSIK